MVLRNLLPISCQIRILPKNPRSGPFSAHGSPSAALRILLHPNGTTIVSRPAEKAAPARASAAQSINPSSRYFLSLLRIVRAEIPSFCAASC